jgi:cytochrome c oxidase cbb3-type subunit IV
LGGVSKQNIIMFKNALSSIEGVSVFPIFSLIVFFVFFTALGLWVFKADKKYVKHMENLPFDKEK